MKEQEPRIRVNDEIRVPEVRLIGADGSQIGVVTIEEALRQAEESSLDLVEVAPLAKPPVCKIIDLGKVLFDQRRRQRLQRKRQHRMEIKEVKLKLKIDKHDYDTKIKSAQKFLNGGDKVKFTIVFRGREITHQDIGRELSDRVLADLAFMAELEGTVNRAGRQHTFLVSRRKDYRPPADSVKKDAADEVKKDPADKRKPEAAEKKEPATEAEPTPVETPNQ